MRLFILFLFFSCERNGCDFLFILFFYCFLSAGELAPLKISSFTLIIIIILFIYFLRLLFSVNLSGEFTHIFWRLHLFLFLFTALAVLFGGTYISVCVCLEEGLR